MKTMGEIKEEIIQELRDKKATDEEIEAQMPNINQTAAIYVIEQIDQALALLGSQEEDLQTIVGVWAEETFIESTNASICTHLRREAKELSEDYNPEEAADCLLCLLHFAYKNRFNLLAEAQKKHLINTKRKWGKPDAEGVVEHIRSQPVGEREEDATMWECWGVHPVDDNDCLDCPSVRDCREVRKEFVRQAEKLTEELKEKDAEIEAVTRRAESAESDWQLAEAKTKRLKDRNKQLVTENQLLRTSINEHQRAIDKVVEENKRLRGMLRDALPHIECKNDSQSGLITEIGEYLNKC